MVDLKELTDPRIGEDTKKKFGLQLVKAIEIALAVKSPQGYREAADFLLYLKKQQKWWAEYNRPLKQQIDQLKRAALEREREVAEPMERAEREYLKPAMMKYDQQVADQRRRDEQAAQSQLKKEREDEALARASKLEAEGKTQEAAAVVEEPIVTPAVVIPDTNKTKGISYKTDWKFEIINKDLIPRAYLKVDEVAIRGIARALKDKANIPGVKFYGEKTMAAGGR